MIIVDGKGVLSRRQQESQEAHMAMRVEEEAGISEHQEAVVVERCSDSRLA